MPPSPSPAPAGTTQLKGAAASSPEARTATDEEEVRPYVLSAEIGKGSFATVYRGYHEVRPHLSFAFSMHNVAFNS